MRYLIALVVCSTVAATTAKAQDAQAEVRARDQFLANVAKGVREHPREIGRGALAWLLDREAVLRLLSILSGTPPTGDSKSGWIVPTRTTYSAKWLVQRFDRDGDGVVARDELPGPADWFQKLDRDRDGFVSPVDLDWSPKSPLNKASGDAKMLFRVIDTDGDGQVSAAEWRDYLGKLAPGRDYLVQDDLIPLFASVGKKGKAGAPPGFSRGINTVLFKAFFDGDVASIFEGPRPGDSAPDFTLPTPDGKSSFTLSSQFGKRPIVLNFGSFT